MSKNIEIHTHADPEDTFVDVPGTSSGHSGKPKQARIFGQADAIAPGSITDREAPVYDEDMTPEKAVERVLSNSGRAFTLFNTSGDAA